MDMAFRTNLRFSQSLALFSMAAVLVIYRRMVWKIGLCPRIVYFLLCAEVMVSGLVLLIVSGRKEVRSSRTLYWKYLRFYIYSACLVSPCIATLDYLAKGQEVYFVPLTAAVFCVLHIPPVYSLVLPAVSYLVIPFIITSSMGIEITFHPVMWFLTILMSAVALMRWDFIGDFASMEARLTATNERLKNVSEKDELTGLRNRMGLRNDYDHYANMRLIVAMTDIDNFKFYNDTYGHDTGDLILKDMADNLRKQFGDAGVYRFGGDEFLIIQTGLDDQDFERTTVNWKKSLKPRMFGELELCPEFTIGFVYGNTHGSDDLRKMISQADEQLYQGKSSGKGRITGSPFSDGLKKPVSDHENAPRVLDADPLTGLPNAMYFRVKSDLQAEALRKAGKDPVLIYTSIDEFQNFSRNQGFAAADALLKELAGDLRKVFPSDLVCRFSEDHFLVLTDRERVKYMQKAFPEIISASPALSIMRIHMGLYACAKNSSSAVDRVDCARMACEEIRNTDVLCFWYDWNLQQEKSRRAYILAHLSEAIEKRRIELEFVPAVRLITQETSELEIVSVWNDPRWGRMDEEMYLPVLEEAGRAIELNSYLLKESVQIMETRKKAGKKCVPMVRKLSVKEFIDQEFRKDGIGLLDRAGLDHSILSFGISESAFSSENRVLNREVRKVRQEGFRVWLDDFGVGNMAMNGLLDPEFDAVRINLRSMKNINDQNRYDTILTSMLSLARTLHLSTVVSGIEGNEESKLILYGCQKLQKTAEGSEFPADQLEEQLNSGRISPFEERNLRSYYDAIGAISLKVSPSEMAPAPAAIFEAYDGHCRCLRWNREFLDLLEEFDVHEGRELDQEMDTEPYRSWAIGQVREAEKDPRWHSIVFPDAVSMNGACRLAAEDDTGTHIAVLTVFFGPLRNSIGTPEA